MVIENTEPCRESQKQGEEADGMHALTAGRSHFLRQEKPAMAAIGKAKQFEERR